MAGLLGVANIADDVIIHGTDTKEHDKNLMNVHVRGSTIKTFRILSPWICQIKRIRDVGQTNSWTVQDTTYERQSCTNDRSTTRHHQTTEQPLRRSKFLNDYVLYWALWCLHCHIQLCCWESDIWTLWYEPQGPCLLLEWLSFALNTQKQTDG